MFTVQFDPCYRVLSMVLLRYRQRYCPKYFIVTQIARDHQNNTKHVTLN